MVHFSFFPQKRLSSCISLCQLYCGLPDSSILLSRSFVLQAPSLCRLQVRTPKQEVEMSPFRQMPESPENWTHAPTLPFPEKPGAERSSYLALHWASEGCEERKSAPNHRPCSQQPRPNGLCCQHLESARTETNYLGCSRKFWNVGFSVQPPFFLSMENHGAGNILPIHSTEPRPGTMVSEGHKFCY